VDGALMAVACPVVGSFATAKDTNGLFLSSSTVELICWLVILGGRRSEGGPHPVGVYKQR
jgi:hypothetical protein